MANTNTISIELKVDAASGMATIKSFSDSASQNMKKVEDAGQSMGGGLNQSFSGMSSLSETVKSNWIAATAAITVAMMAVGKAMDYIEIGAKALQIESSFQIMSEAAGVNGTAMVASMADATRHTIDDSDLMQKAVKLMLAGYNADQITEFSKLAVTASQYAGVGVGEAFDRMNDAIANRTPKALVLLGGITRDQMKVVEKAVTDGADSMSLFELVVANLTVKQLQLQGTQDEATISLQQFHAQVSETGETIGKILIIGLQKLWACFQSVEVASLAASAGIYKDNAGREVLGSDEHLGGSERGI